MINTTLKGRWTVGLGSAGAIAVALIVAFAFAPANAGEATSNQLGATEIATSQGLSITSSQVDAFADDMISDAERKAAFNEWIGCIEAAGFDVVESELRYFGESIAIDDPTDSSSSAVASCRTEHYEAIAIAHRATLEIPSGEERTIGIELDRCLASSNSDRMPTLDDPRAAEAYCRRVATDEVLGRP